VRRARGYSKKDPRGLFTSLTAIFAQVMQNRCVAVLNHLGIANGPAWLFAKEIEFGAVRRLFPEYERRKSIFALRAGGRRLAAKTTVFIDFLVEIFAKIPSSFHS
jgi:DNA-binding transcriptional LysR family regulator